MRQTKSSHLIKGVTFPIKKAGSVKADRLLARALTGKRVILTKMRSSSQTVDLFWLIFESAGVTRGNRAGLRVAITEAIGATEALAGRASHDLDDNRRHTALHRARFRHRNVLRLT